MAQPPTTHQHFACPIPPWAAATKFGRAYSRRRLTREVLKKCRETGLEPAGELCFHFGLVDGHAHAMIHFPAVDTLAASLSDDTPT